MEREHYFEEEAYVLVGRRFRCTRAYSGVPAGTTGVVVGTYKAGRFEGRDLFGLDVRWERHPGDDLVDGFSKTDMEIQFPDGRKAMEEA